jgi:hypothetical protein
MYPKRKLFRENSALQRLLPGNAGPSDSSVIHSSYRALKWILSRWCGVFEMLSRGSADISVIVTNTLQNGWCTGKIRKRVRPTWYLRQHQYMLIPCLNEKSIYSDLL